MVNSGFLNAVHITQIYNRLRTSEYEFNVTIMH